MLNLYYVACYDHKNNEWWRLMVSGPDSDTVKSEVQKEMERFHISPPFFICTTPDPIWTEI